MAYFVDLLIKSTVILAVAWSVSGLLRRRAAAERHIVWCVAVAAVALLPLLTAALPPLRVQLPAAVSGPVFRMTAASTAAGERMPQAAPSSKPASAPRRPADHTWNWSLVWLALGAAGTLAALGRVLAGAWLLGRLHHGARELEDREALDRAARQLGISRHVRLLETDAAGVPMTAGILHPAVYLPVAAREWDEERRHVVLLHELAHIRRHDAATGFAARLALAFWWWQPLAWVATAALLRERERAADDLVLAAGARPSDYAGHLLELAATFRAAAGTAAAAVCMARPSELEGRLGSILDAGIRRRTAGPAFAAAVAVAAALVVMPLAAMRPQAESTVPATTAEVDALVRTAVAERDVATLKRLASGLVQQHRYTDAERAVAAGVEVTAARSGKESLEYAGALAAQARLKQLEGKREEARETYQQAQKIREAAGKPGLVALRDAPPPPPPPPGKTDATASGNLASPEAEKSSLTVAKSQYEQELARGPAAGVRGHVLTSLAQVEAKLGETAAAEAHYRDALIALPAGSADAATASELLAMLLERQAVLDGQHPAAESQLLREGAAKIRANAVARLSDFPPDVVVKIAPGSGIAPPKLTYKVEPQYTEVARAAKLSGRSVLSVEVGVDGRAHAIKLVKSLGLGLDEMAANAVKQWKFTPATKDGAPVAVTATIEVNFRLW
jgi:TonB family protein